jgi:hypothetical protein
MLIRPVAISLSSLLLLSSCSSKVEESGEPTDTAVTTTTTTVDTALFTFVVAGTASIDHDGTDYTEWDGQESIIVYNVTDAESVCVTTYDAYSTTSLAGCDLCEFAFDVTISDGIASGDGCAERGIGDQPGEITTRGWGFGTYEAPDGSVYEDVLWYYFPDEQEWYALAMISATPQGAGLNLEYTVGTGYYYYYTY